MSYKTFSLSIVVVSCVLGVAAHAEGPQKTNKEKDKKKAPEKVQPIQSTLTLGGVGATGGTQYNDKVTSGTVGPHLEQHLVHLNGTKSSSSLIDLHDRIAVGIGAGKDQKNNGSGAAISGRAEFAANGGLKLHGGICATYVGGGINVDAQGLGQWSGGSVVGRTDGNVQLYPTGLACGKDGMVFVLAPQIGVGSPLGGGSSYGYSFVGGRLFLQSRDMVVSAEAKRKYGPKADEQDELKFAAQLALNKNVFLGADVRFEDTRLDKSIPDATGRFAGTGTSVTGGTTLTVKIK